MLSSQYTNLSVTAEKLAYIYQTNRPFPNIYLDNFFDPNFLEEVLREFPNVEKLKDKLTYTNPNEQKLATKGEVQFGLNPRSLL
jgi:hypothetical protein